MTTLQQLDQFTRFARVKLSSNDESLSIEECLQLWRQQTEEDEAIADIEQSQLDFAAGRSMPVKDAFDDVRRRLGISQ